MTNSLLQCFIGLKPYLHIATANMENVTLIEHKEFARKCEEMDEKDKYHAIMDVHDASKKKTKKKEGDMHLFQKNKSQ